MKVNYSFIAVPRSIYLQLEANELKLLTYLIDKVGYYENIGKTFKRSMGKVSEDLGWGKNRKRANGARDSLKAKGIIDFENGTFGGKTDSTKWHINWEMFNNQNGTSSRHQNGTSIRHQNGTSIRHQNGTSIRHQNGAIYKNNENKINAKAMLDTYQEFPF